MYNFNRGNKRFGGGRNFSDREMHRTTCSKCGNDCEVPFRPTGERPVYCSKCFENNRSSDSRRFDERNTRGRFNNYSENRNDKGSSNIEGQFKKQFETLNWKLDKILKILNPAVAPQVIQTEKIEKKGEVVKPKKSTKSSKKEKPIAEETT